MTPEHLRNLWRSWRFGARLGGVPVNKCQRDKISPRTVLSLIALLQLRNKKSPIPKNSSVFGFLSHLWPLLALLHDWTVSGRSSQAGHSSDGSPSECFICCVVFSDERCIQVLSLVCIRPCRILLESATSPKQARMCRSTGRVCEWAFLPFSFGFRRVQLGLLL